MQNLQNNDHHTINYRPKTSHAMQYPFKCHDFNESIPNRTRVKLNISGLNVLLLSYLKTKTTTWDMINQILPTCATAEEKVL